MVRQIMTKSRLAAVFVLFLLVFGVSYGGYLVWSTLRSSEAQFQSQLVTQVYDFESELLGFERDLNAFGSGIPDVGPSNVRDRFSALRAELWKLQSIGFASDPRGAGGAPLARLAEELLRAQPTIDSLQNTVDGQARALLVALEIRPYLEEVAELTTETVAQVEADYAIAMEQLEETSLLANMISAVAAMVALILASMLIYDGYDNYRLSRSNAQLANRAEGAAKVRSSFLAMMSHDLRTPLNGLLGTISLVRAQGVTGNQDRLLDQADRAGQRLQMILSDIFDFSALQDETLKPDSLSFEPRFLRDQVLDLVSDEARRQNVAVSADISASGFQRVQGDPRLLRQAIGHVLIYLLEAAGTRAVAMRFSVDHDELIVRLIFDYRGEGGGWVPDLIVGGAARSGEQMISDAFGPALARALLDVQGGEILLDAEGQERVKIEIRTGAKTHVDKPLRVLLSVGSVAVTALCEARLASLDAVFVSEDDLDRVDIDVAVFDANVTADEHKVATLRERMPSVYVVGLGSLTRSTQFDAVLPLPLKGDELPEAVSAALRA